MIRLMRSLAVLALLSGNALLAQDLSGQWQGPLTLPNGRDLRIVFKISKADGGALKNSMYKAPTDVIAVDRVEKPTEN
jgi:hypothetical protein